MKSGDQPSDKDSQNEEKVTDSKQPASSDSFFLKKASQENVPAPRADPDLNLLSRRLENVTAEAETPLEIENEPEPMDLAARLNFQLPEPPPQPQPAPPPPPEPLASNPPVPVVPPPQVAPVELLRLLRDPDSGQLIVEVAGQQYTKLADIADRKVGQYALKLVAHLLVFTNGIIVTRAGMKSVYNPRGKVDLVPEPLASPKIAAQPSPEVEAAFLASLPAGAPTPPPPPVKKGFLGFGGEKSKKSMAGGIPDLNLADEINEIVQNRLRYSPLSTAAQVEITSNVGGGICINVDGHVYSSPDEVPDSAVRNLIKASIKEWNES